MPSVPPDQRLSLPLRMRRTAALLIRSGFEHWRLAGLRSPYLIVTRGRSGHVLSDDSPGAATCYREVVVEDCYRMFRLPRSFTPACIVDIGANIGVFSKLCSVMFPDAQIHAYEPNPAAFAWLVKNAKGSNIVATPSAVASEAGTMRFDLAQDSTLGHISHDGETTVQAVSADDVGGGNPIDLLKMDCEGGEWAILRKPDLLRRSVRLCMEYHLSDEHPMAELRDRIAEGGHQIEHIEDRPAFRSGLLVSVRQ